MAYTAISSAGTRTTHTTVRRAWRAAWPDGIVTDADGAIVPRPQRKPKPPSKGGPITAEKAVVLLSAELLAKVDRAASQARLSRSAYIREVLTEELRDGDDFR